MAVYTSMTLGAPMEACTRPMPIGRRRGATSFDGRTNHKTNVCLCVCLRSFHIVLLCLRALHSSIFV